MIRTGYKGGFMATHIAVPDLVDLVRHIEHQKGKYVKQTLARLEQEGKLDKVTRKRVLDGMNSFARAIYRPWYDVEE
jgi:hypothetical protein